MPRGSTSGTVAALTVHQGCGLTNALTGIGEAAKSRTPLLALAAEATEPRSNFSVDQEALAHAVGAVTARVTSAEDAVEQACAAVAHEALHERRTVLLNLPLDAQSLEAPDEAPTVAAPPPERTAVEPVTDDVAALAQVLKQARRPASWPAGIARTPRPRCPGGARRAPRCAAGHVGRRARAVPRRPVVARRVRRLLVSPYGRADPGADLSIPWAGAAR
ncbi:hypothetical protein SANTM175S_04954 [Streptomyces antimycoticus]